MATRQEAINQILESFVHDRLNRLQSYTVASSSDAGATRTVTMDYNAIGNLINKSDVGGYAYASARPHAPTSVGGTAFSYDDNGNVTASSGNQARALVWNYFNQAQSITYRGSSTVFTFDHSYKRIVEVATQGSTERRVNFVHPDNQGGLGYEREETRISGTLTKTESRHYISVGGAVIAVVKTLNDSGVVPSDVNATNYWHKDALGSIVAVTNASGVVLERMAFDPWGRRVRDTGMADPTVNPANGDRGFTGHEHLDEVALIHMNGRVYDPLLGKFLSVDPIVGDPNNLQAYNRYGYVFNQPTRYADPSGNCPVCFFVVGALLAMEGNKYWRVVGNLMMFWALAPGGGNLVETGLGAAGAFSSQSATLILTNPVVTSAIAGGVTGFVSSGGDFEAAFTEGVFAAVTAGIGQSVGAGSSTFAKGTSVVAHAMVGCVRGQLSGGGCGPSAMAGAFGKLTTFGTDGMGIGPAQFAVTTLVGGTVSVIGGGKFANGAYQAAFGYLFNQMSRPGRPSISLQVESAIVRGDMQQLQRLAAALGPEEAALVESILARDALGKTLTMSEASLQHAFRRAAEFGVKGNWNKAAGTEFAAALEAHVGSPATQAIHGWWRGEQATIFFNAQNNLTVVRTTAGELWTAFRATAGQAENLLRSARLGGGG